MRESARIFFACALGAFIGGLLGLELNSVSTWLWLPSALLGGAIGWVAYDVRALGAAIARAWREVIGWRPDRLYWRLFSRTILVGITITGYGALMPLSWYASFVLADAAWFTWPILQNYLYEGFWFVGLLTSIFAFAAAVLFGIVLLVLFPFEPEARTEAGWDSSIGWTLRFCRKIAFVINPIIWPFMLSYYLYQGGRWSIPRIPTACRLTGQFCQRAFILAHSDLRLLCLVDATIGALAGYFLSSALLGALVGGVWGLFNYWIVSIKLLHLNPARARNE